MVNAGGIFPEKPWSVDNQIEEGDFGYFWNFNF